MPPTILVVDVRHPVAAAAYAELAPSGSVRAAVFCSGSDVVSAGGPLPADGYERIDVVQDPDSVQRALAGGVHTVLLALPDDVPTPTDWLKLVQLLKSSGTVKTIVLLSSLCADVPTLVFGSLFNPLEALIESLAPDIGSVFLRLGLVLEQLVPDDMLHERHAVVLPLARDKTLAVVSLRDAARCAARVCTAPDEFNGTIQNITAPQEITPGELARALQCPHLREPYPYPGRPDVWVQGVTELLELAEQGRLVSSAYDDAVQLLDATRRPLLSAAEWAAQHPLRSELAAASAASAASGSPAAGTAAGAATAPATAPAAGTTAPDAVSVQGITVSLAPDAAAAAGAAAADGRRPVVLVTSAASSVGLATVQALMHRHAGAVEVRAAVRDVARAGKLASLGVPLVPLDTAQPESVARALTGVDRLLIVPPVDPERRAAVAALASGAAAAGVSMLVLLGHLAVDAVAPTAAAVLAGGWAAGTASAATAAAAAATGAGAAAAVGTAADLATPAGRDEPVSPLVAEFAAMEQAVLSSGVRSCVLLRPGVLMESLFAFARPLQATGVLRVPLRADAPLALVAVTDVALAAAAVLTGDPQAHGGLVLRLTAADAASMAQFASLLTAALNRVVAVEPVSPAVFEQSLLEERYPPWLARATIEQYRLANEGRALHQCFSDLALLGIAPTRLPDWVGLYVSSFTPAASASGPAVATAAATGAAAAAAAAAAATTGATGAAPVAGSVTAASSPMHVSPAAAMAASAGATGAPAAATPPAPPKPLVLVTGATGNIGLATVQALLQRHVGVEVRAAVSDINKAEKLAALPVQLAVLDMNAPHSVEAALQGVDRLFLLHDTVAVSTTASTALADAAKAAGVKFIVLCSIVLADRSDLVYGRQFGQLEAHVRALGVPYAVLRAHMLMESNFGFAATIKTHGAMFGPLRPDARFAPVSVSDLGRAAAVVLAQVAPHLNRTYHITGPESVSMGELASLFAAALGQPVRYEQVSWEAALSGMLAMGYAEWQAQATLELYRDIEQGGRMSAVSPDLAHILGVRGTTNAEWVAAVALSFVDRPPSAEEVAAAAGAGGVFESVLPTRGRLAVYGASGSTGVELVRAALDEGYAVRAAVRSLRAFPLIDRRVEVMRCDVTDAAQVAAVLEGCSAALFAVGHDGLRASTVLTDGMANVVRAATAAGVQRVVAVSCGLVERSEHEPCCLAHCGRALLRNVTADLQGMEAVLRRSNLDWTIVRPFNLTHASARGRYRLLPEVGRIRGAENTVSRADLATFVIQEVGGRRWVRRAVAISD